VKAGHLGIVEVLLKSGSDIQLTESYSQAAGCYYGTVLFQESLECALQIHIDKIQVGKLPQIYFKSVSITELLIDYVYDADPFNEFLMIMIMFLPKITKKICTIQNNSFVPKYLDRNLEILRRSLQKGANPNYQNKGFQDHYRNPHNDRPLHILLKNMERVENYNISVFPELLLKYGASPYLTNDVGETAIDLVDSYINRVGDTTFSATLSSYRPPSLQCLSARTVVPYMCNQYFRESLSKPFVQTIEKYA